MSRKIKLPRILANKKLWVVLLVVLALGAAFNLGDRLGKSSQSNSATPDTTSFQSLNQHTTTVQALRDQSNQAAQHSQHQPSSGHLNLSGNVTEVSNSSISLKLANGQTLTFSLPSDVLVMVINPPKAGASHTSSAASHTIKDVKKGDSAVVMVTVSADGTFVVRTIRTYPS